MAEPIEFNNPPASYLSSTPGFTIVKRLVWYGLAPDIRKGYTLAINLFESFYVLQQKPAWPTTIEMLEEWVAYCIYESTLPKQDQVKPKTMSSYLSALKSYHIDRHLSLEAFDTPRITLIIKGRKRQFSKEKATRLPIITDILEKITDYEPVDLDELNINMAFKMA